MPKSSLGRRWQDIIVWSKSAGGDAARPVVPIVILVRRYTALTGRGAVSDTGPATRTR